MKSRETTIPGVLVIEPSLFGDERGWFMETYQRGRYVELGLPADFVQDNLAFSTRGVLRGLHVQHPHGQGKLVQVLLGEVFDVAVDIRVGSPTFGKWEAAMLVAEAHNQFYIPSGFAHGYYVLSDSALFNYKCTDNYHPETQFSIRWDDPDIGIEWPLGPEPLLADKDRDAPLLREVPDQRLPRFSQ